MFFAALLALVSVSALSSLDAGMLHTCMTYGQGYIMCWGNGDSGRLGYGNTNNIGDDEVPAVAGVVNVGVGMKATAVAAGEEHSCALLESRDVMCWGLGVYGRLGYGNTNDIGDNELPVFAGVVDLGNGVNATAVAAGGFHTCVLLDSGDVMCWGRSTSGQLGLGAVDDIGDDETPASAGAVNLGVGVTVRAISAGVAHTCALLDSGDISCWGQGYDGRLGYGNTNNIGDNEDPAIAGMVNIGVGIKAAAVSAGGYHTCALLETGDVMCWGDGRYGRLGYGKTSNVGDDENPVSAGVVNLGNGIKATAVSAGVEHTCALLESGDVMCWGRGIYGQLGYGTTENIGDNEDPAVAGVVDLGQGMKATAISVGNDHSCALLETGEPLCWGRGFGGRLGHGNEENVFSPSFVQREGCDPGQYSSDFPSVFCFPCLQGTWAGANATKCKGCPAGRWSSAVLVDSVNSCNLCSAGTWSSVLGAQTASTCTSCPKGTWSKDGASKCEECPVATWSNSTGVSTCKRCPAGTASNETRASSLSICRACPSGTWSDAGSTSCFPCPAGTASNATGVPSVSGCIPCKPGSYSSQASLSCTPCPEGTHAERDGSDSCKDCSPGSFSNAIGSQRCTLCTHLYFQPAAAALSCEPCPYGTSSGEGAASCVSDVSAASEVMAFIIFVCFMMVLACGGKFSVWKRCVRGLYSSKERQEKSLISSRSAMSTPAHRTDVDASQQPEQAVSGAEIFDELCKFWSLSPEDQEKTVSKAAQLADEDITRDIVDKISTIMYQDWYSVKSSQGLSADGVLQFADILEYSLVQRVGNWADLDNLVLETLTLRLNDDDHRVRSHMLDIVYNVISQRPAQCTSLDSMILQIAGRLEDADDQVIDIALQILEIAIVDKIGSQTVCEVALLFIKELAQTHSKPGVRLLALKTLQTVSDKVVNSTSRMTTESVLMTLSDISRLDTSEGNRRVASNVVQRLSKSPRQFGRHWITMTLAFIATAGTVLLAYGDMITDTLFAVELGYLGWSGTLSLASSQPLRVGATLLLLSMVSTFVANGQIVVNFMKQVEALKRARTSRGFNQPRSIAKKSTSCIRSAAESIMWWTLFAGCLISPELLRNDFVSTTLVGIDCPPQLSIYISSSTWIPSVIEDVPATVVQLYVGVATSNVTTTAMMATFATALDVSLRLSRSLILVALQKRFNLKHSKASISAAHHQVVQRRHQTVSGLQSQGLLRSSTVDFTWFFLLWSLNLRATLLSLFAAFVGVAARFTFFGCAVSVLGIYYGTMDRPTPVSIYLAGAAFACLFVLFLSLAFRSFLLWRVFSQVPMRAIEAAEIMSHGMLSGFVAILAVSGSLSLATHLWHISPRTAGRISRSEQLVDFLSSSAFLVCLVWFLGFGETDILLASVFVLLFFFVTWIASLIAVIFHVTSKTDSSLQRAESLSSALFLSHLAEAEIEEAAQIDHDDQAPTIDDLLDDEQPSLAATNSTATETLNPILRLDQTRRNK